MAGEADGLPLAVVISAANANDATMLEAVLNDIPAIRMPPGGVADGPANSTPTRRMTIAAAAPSCAGVASNRGSPAA